MSARLAPTRLPLPDVVLGRLTVAKARATFRALHPDVERQPVTVYLMASADYGGDE